MCFYGKCSEEAVMKKIAVIDDDQDIIDALSLFLKIKGYDVVTAGNIRDGLNLIETEEPDLIFLDVMMDEPDDGFYLAMKLRSKGVQTPIVLLTSISKSTGLDFSQSKTLPVDEFLEKPVSPSVLENIINKYLI